MAKSSKAATTEAPAEPAAKSKAQLKKELAAGAAEIAKAKAAAAKKTNGEKSGAVDGGTLEVVKPAEEEIIIPSERLATDIIREKIQFNEGLTALTIQGEMTAEEWVKVMIYFSEAQEKIGWWIGDMMTLGDKALGGKYPAAIRATGFAQQTLWNYNSVCRQVPAANRLKGLSFSHHIAVASVDKKEQKPLLKLAEKNKLSVRDLAAEVKKHKEAKAALLPPKGSVDLQLGMGQGGAETGQQAPSDSQPVQTGPGEVAVESEHSGVVIVEDGASAATNAAPVKIYLTETERQDCDTAIEKSDIVAAFLRGPVFKKLNAADLAVWERILKPFAEKYNELKTAQ